MPSKAYQTCMRIKAELEAHYSKEVPRSVVEQLIMREAGINARTISDYFKALEKFGVIRPGRHFNLLELGTTKPGKPAAVSKLSKKERELLEV